MNIFFYSRATWSSWAQRYVDFDNNQLDKMCISYTKGVHYDVFWKWYTQKAHLALKSCNWSSVFELVKPPLLLAVKRNAPPSIVDKILFLYSFSSYKLNWF